MVRTEQSELMSDRLRAVVDYFICRSNESNGKMPLTNKKLQKLLYYAQAWNLVFNGEKLFVEDIEAWVHGPVVPVVYRKYKEYGYTQIVEDAKIDESKFTHSELETLDEVWKVYGKFDGDYLEILSHSEDPWIVARGQAEINESCTTIISPTLMREFYTERNK